MSFSDPIVEISPLCVCMCVVYANMCVQVHAHMWRIEEATRHLVLSLSDYSIETQYLDEPRVWLEVIKSWRSSCLRLHGAGVTATCVAMPRTVHGH